MSDQPAFLDTDRPDVPDIVTARGMLPFYLPALGLRGRLVRLGPLAQALLTRHDNAPAVTELTGRALALAALLAGALKFQGSFSLQAKGDGPVSLLLADCTDVGALRGYALMREGADEIADDDAALLGKGVLAFTVDQGSGGERHQGIVEIDGDSLAEMAEHYFRTSEQMGCLIRLACGQTARGWRAAGLILERIAAEGGVEVSEAAPDEAWRTGVALASTVTEAELLDDALPAEDVLWRLFGTEGVEAGMARALAYGCRCSRARLASILEGFPAEDLDDMAQEDEIVMTCEFCNHDFRFAREAVRSRTA